MASNPSTGDSPIRIKRMEYWKDVIMMKNSSVSRGDDQFVTSKFPKVFQKFADMYENYIIHSMSVVFKTTSSTTRDGSIVFGIDYNAENPQTPEDASSVFALPSRSGPLYSPTLRLQLKLQPGLVRLTKGKTPPNAPFSLTYYATTEQSGDDLYLGRFFIEYDVEFRGLKA